MTEPTKPAFTPNAAPGNFRRVSPAPGQPAAPHTPGLPAPAGISPAREGATRVVEEAPAIKHPSASAPEPTAATSATETKAETLASLKVLAAQAVSIKASHDAMKVTIDTHVANVAAALKKANI